MLTLYGFLIAICTFAELVDLLDTGEIVTPFRIYRDTNMNWFGCWFYFVCISICSPLFVISKIVIFSFGFVYDFIYWLFHVGRKDDE